MELILKGNNVYRNGELYKFKNGDALLTREQLIIIGTEEDTYYTVKKEDSLLLISYNHYKDKVEMAARYWWIIADANNIPNPLNLDDLVGKEILIPNILTVLLNV